MGDKSNIASNPAPVEITSTFAYFEKSTEGTNHEVLKATFQSEKLSEDQKKEILLSLKSKASKTDFSLELDNSNNYVMTATRNSGSSPGLFTIRQACLRRSFSSVEELCQSVIHVASDQPTSLALSC